MPDADSSHPEESPEFRSPKRALARAFRLSRDRWKQKAAVRPQQIKARQARARALKASRALRKDKALPLQAQLQALQAGATPQPDGCTSAPPTQPDPAATRQMPPDP